MRYITSHIPAFLYPPTDGGHATDDGETADGAGAEAAAENDSQQESGTQDDGRTFTQAEVDAIIADRLKRQEKALLRKLEKAQQEAADEKLKDEAQWQQLADKRQARIAQLEAELETAQTRLDQLDAYEKSVKTFADKLSDPLPDGVKALLAKLPPVEQLNWLTEHGHTGTAVLNGPPATPAPKDAVPLSEDQRRKMSYRASL